MKKIFSILAIACVAFVFSSCSVESKTKSYYEDQADLDLEIAELGLEKLENTIDYYEYVKDLDDEDLKEWKKKRDNWEKEVAKENKEDFEEIKKEAKELNKKINDLKEDIQDRLDDLD